MMSVAVLCVDAVVAVAPVPCCADELAAATPPTIAASTKTKPARRLSFLADMCGS
jgi:hypothetical protein